MASGKTADITLFRESCGNFDFSKLSVWVDLGFLGIGKDITPMALHIPWKSSKNHPLDVSKKEDNRIMAGVRVIVENCLAMLKRYFVLRIENRMIIKAKMDDAVLLCSYLWHFKKKLTYIKLIF